MNYHQKMNPFMNLFQAMCYCRFRLLVHMGDKNTFCPPIKIQSFDNQTSKFTRPLENILAPLYKKLKGGSIVGNAYGNLSFEVLTI